MKTRPSTIYEPVRDITNAIRDAFISPNVLDSNLEPANLVDVGTALANGIKRIAAALERLAEILEREKNDGTRP